MDINVWAVVVATVAQFIVGGIWYMLLFGNLWGEMHGFNKLSKAEQDEARKKMQPLLLVQLVVTAVTTVVFAKAIVALPDYSVYALAFWAWLGFVLPVQTSAVVFGGTEPKWMITKIAIQAASALICLLVAAAILQAF